MQAAAKTLGQIVEVGGPVFDEAFMDFEVPAAIEKFQSGRQDPGGYAGVLILKELALHNSMCFHSHIPLVFEKLLVSLRDIRLIVREAAAELLASCLDIILQRERQSKTQFLLKILQDAQGGLKTNVTETIHGSLLTFRELFLHAGMVRQQVLSLLSHMTSFAVHEGSL